ncbi:MAG: hypothetical protein M3Z03_07445 [Actinomycetota bacterium]|nr:hypothetical protein [Actinomycetota bacterium]
MTRRSRRFARPCGGALALAGLLLTMVSIPAAGQDAGGTVGYEFASLHALADGVTVDFNLEGFLPIEDLVGLSSITAESHFGAGRSDALAALPDPGDLILTLPGTLSALVGISGLPDYPAAASADKGSQPIDDIQVAPDAGLGALRLHAEASETESSAYAHVGHQVDTVGILPSFSVGTIRTTARTTQVNAATLEAVATSEVSNLHLLGGLLSIGTLTTQVEAEVVDDQVRVTTNKVVVSGATLAGVPIGITDEGIVGLGSALPLAPVIDTLVAPLLAQGIQVRTTPAIREVGDRTAVARSGALMITVPISVQGYPGLLDVAIGRTLAELEVGALAGGDDTASFDDGGGVVDVGPLPGLGTTVGELDFGLPGGSGSGAGSGGGRRTELVSVPAGRVIADWDLTNLYRVLLLGGIGLFAAGQVVVRSTLRPTRRPNDLRQLWRW